MGESLTVQLSANSQQARVSAEVDYNVLYEDQVQITYQQTYGGHVDVDPTQKPCEPTHIDPPHPIHTDPPQLGIIMGMGNPCGSRVWVPRGYGYG